MKFITNEEVNNTPKQIETYLNEIDSMRGLVRNYNLIKMLNLRKKNG
jgi:hypothetical protein